MKIALLASGTIKSSLTARLVNIGRELVKRGHVVYIIAPSADKYNDFKSEKNVIEVDGIKVIYPYQFTTKYKVFNFIPYIPLAYIKLFLLRPDIIQIYKPTPLTLIGLLPSRRKGTKVILDMDDLGSIIIAREGRPRWMVKLIEQCEIYATRAADGIIVASSYLKQLYEKDYPDKKIIWISNGVQRLHPIRERDFPQIIFLGSLNNREVLEPLFKSLPEITKDYSDKKILLHIVGDGTERSYFESFVRQNNLTGAVHFHGWIDSQNLSDLVAAGDLGYYCVPNEDAYKAASSQKLFDYMSYGVVPLVNAVGDLPFYVDHGKGGYIISINNLAVELIQVLKDSAGRMERSRHAHLRTGQLFLWPHLTDDIENLYKNLLQVK